MRLGHRIALGMLLVVAISGGLSTFVGGFLLWQSLRHEADQRVQQDLNAAHEFYAHRVNSIADALRYTAIGERFAEAVGQRDIGYLSPRLDKVRGNASLDVLLATDPTGHVILRAQRPDLAGDSYADDPLLSRVLRGSDVASGTQILPISGLAKENPALAKRAGIRILPTSKASPKTLDQLDSGMVICAAAAVRDPSGALVGALWGGTLLNGNYDLVDQIRDTVFRDERYQGKLVGTATVFQDDVRVSTNVLREDGSRAVGTRVSAEVYDAVLRNGRTWLGPAWVVDDWYLSAYSPIRDVGGDAAGMLYVGVLQRRFNSVILRTFAVFAAVALSGVLAAGIVAWALAKGIARPVSGLAQASEVIAQGEFSHALPVERDDEIGSLTRSFNTMAESLKERDALLKERTRQQLTRSERLAAAGRLAAGVAHEINNPLTGVLTFAHMLLRDAPEGSQEKEDLEVIIEATIRCKDIVKGLLSFSRQNEPQKTLADLGDVLRKALTLTRNQAHLSQVDTREELDPNLPQLVMDPNQIREVAVNMIVNAIDAMPDGGTLTLCTRHVTEDGAQWAEFEVSDTGCGIAPENRDHIFDPFFTTKHEGKGTGLGLAVSYGIVMEHDGQMKVSSELGQGTTVTVRLPIAPEDPRHDDEDPRSGH